MEEGILNTLSDGVSGALSNPLISAGVGVVGGAVIGSVVTASIISSKRKKSSKRKSTKSRSGRARDRKFSSREKHEQRYKRKTPGKRYKTHKKSRKGIHYTKKGQPYRILANGRARFVKK